MSDESKWEQKHIIEEMSEDIKCIRSDLGEVKVTLAEQHKSIDYHIKRTDLLEETVETLRKDFKPVEDHVKGLQFTLKVIGGVSLILGVVYTIISIIKSI